VNLTLLLAVVGLPVADPTPVVDPTPVADPTTVAHPELVDVEATIRLPRHNPTIGYQRWPA
jgi:hypothetical protein